MDDRKATLARDRYGSASSEVSPGVRSASAYDVTHLDGEVGKSEGVQRIADVGDRMCGVAVGGRIAEQHDAASFDVDDPELADSGHSVQRRLQLSIVQQRGV